MPHGFLHEHAIHEFAQTSGFTIAQPRDMDNRGRARKRMKMDPLKRYIAEPIHQIREHLQPIEFCGDQIAPPVLSQCFRSHVECGLPTCLEFRQ